jgi:hypothetical protein
MSLTKYMGLNGFNNCLYAAIILFVKVVIHKKNEISSVLLFVYMILLDEIFICNEQKDIPLMIEN